MNSSRLSRLGISVYSVSILVALVAVLSLATTDSRSQPEPQIETERTWPLAGGEPVPHPVPDPEFDVEHYAIHLDFDLEDERLDGSIDVRGRAVAAPLRRVALHAAQLDVSTVTDPSGNALPFESDGKMLFITPPEPLEAGEEFIARITYSAHPMVGVYFVSPKTVLDLPDRHEIWTQGEEEDNRHWFPCWDYPNDKATTEIWLTIPEEWNSVSNGELVEITPGPRPGTAIHHWNETVPHVTYLTSFAVGNYEVKEDEVDGIKLMYLYPPGEWERVQRIWRGTPEMIRYFNRVTGYRFPYAKYAQVTVTGLFAAMENVGATTFETRQAMQDSSSYPTYRYERTTMHELVHQWFGDLITCNDWGHIWLNESFATYFDAVYTEHLEGPDEFAVRMRTNRRRYLSEDQDKYRRPVVEPVYTDPMDIFDRHAYPGGSWRLHQLRDVLTDFETGSDETFWRGIRKYTSDYAEQSVRTDQFRLAMEQASGRDLGWFFNQWLYKAGYPELRVVSTWSEERRALEIEVEQTQAVDSLTPLFRFPVTIEIAGPTGNDLHRVWIAKRHELLSFPLAAPPSYVRFDRDNRVLKTMEWERDAASLMAQLSAATDAEGRIDACEALTDHPGNEAAIAALRNALLTDSFHGVRSVAAKSLGEIKGEAALDALLEAAGDPDPRVRKTVIAELGNFGGEERATETVKKALKDANDHVAANAASSIARLEPTHAAGLLERALSRNSYRDCVRDSALRAFATLGDTRHLSTLMRWTSPKRSPYARRGAAIALGRLGFNLGPGGPEVERRQGVRLELEGLLADRNGPVRSGAIAGLGYLADAEALPVLIRIRDGKVGDFALAGRERNRAYLAINDILRHQAQLADRATVERRLRELEEQNQELRSELETIRKRLESGNQGQEENVTKR
jgi:aminopeptidase N